MAPTIASLHGSEVGLAAEDLVPQAVRTLAGALAGETTATGIHHLGGLAALATPEPDGAGSHHNGWSRLTHNSASAFISPCDKGYLLYAGVGSSTTHCA